MIPAYGNASSASENGGSPSHRAVRLDQRHPLLAGNVGSDPDLYRLDVTDPTMAAFASSSAAPLLDLTPGNPRSRVGSSVSSTRRGTPSVSLRGSRAPSPARGGARSLAVATKPPPPSSPMGSGGGGGGGRASRQGKRRNSDALDQEEWMLAAVHSDSAQSRSRSRSQSSSEAAGAHAPMDHPYRSSRRHPPWRRFASALGACITFPCWLPGLAWHALVRSLRRPPPHLARSFTVPLLLDQRPARRREFPPNVVRNQKYSLFSFLPLVLYEQFKFFFNLYFLLVALSQFVPALKVGYLVTYVAPLAFVLLVTLAKEAADDWARRQRDREANSQCYDVLDAITAQFHPVPSAELAVGDIVRLAKNQRVPADMVLLHTHERAGTCFIRTDQLDGETDWKVRVAVPATHAMVAQQAGARDPDACLAYVVLRVDAEPPSRDIHAFSGTIAVESVTAGSTLTAPEPLTADHMLWMNTVVASDPVVACVVYTGADTRAVRNTSHATAKIGLLDHELNQLAKILFAVTFALSGFMVYGAGLHGPWGVYLVRFLILFSSIIPISLRVNLDFAKTYYARCMERDPDMPETVVRTSTIPEDLGRIEFLLTDKTGTLTRNEMEMKKVHLGTMAFGSDALEDLRALVLGDPAPTPMTAIPSTWGGGSSGGAARTRDMAVRARELVLALALCHNVTPVVSETDGSVMLQAASPDEMALVRFAQNMGLALVHRDQQSMTIKFPDGQERSYTIVAVFPFTSESKRMGIVVQDTTQGSSGEALFYEKGADTVMARLVAHNDWIDEECGNMAREGLRTLVVARKRLTADTLARFLREYQAARTALTDRAAATARVISQWLERDLEPLGVTGVEDKLQDDVRPTLEALRNAGIKVWMLTGDKVETATCIALSSKLVARTQALYTVTDVRDAHAARAELDRLGHAAMRGGDACLIIDGPSLATCLDACPAEFLAVASRLGCVVCCRCAPTQKAQITTLIKTTTGKRVLAIGDGGNDVAMIQAADVGVGIFGKEGRQAALAADFAVPQFAHLTRLLLWHGRNSYQRSAKLAQFIIHRGLIITVMQAVFSAMYYFAPIALFQGMLLVGYTTIYTNAPVFSLILDHDVPADLALLFPELYRDLVKGRALSYRTFFAWLLVSVYQGGAIMMLALLLFDRDLVHMVAISFTALIVNELVMVMVEIVTWHRYMAYALIATVAVYVASMAILPEFDMSFVLTTAFVAKVAAMAAISCVPLVVLHRAKLHFAPPSYQKLVNHH
ncbi:phospholipid-translocating P-type ATPase, flippase [Allomyces macrogynus ATCC 38327]|uniref:Phospholipid-transporting ATPase n=1 Tax=Allomyces macrogynus (strain ATCC 38327) TaxID=578462 RepID=A0A0L0SZG3_ALLM3|nr:phospholipid-translocating P-type ATPase, flippase [Allomyces macrogynus ATCC 38327]|eukprot:KNE67897.1 phospholipid-translocating P-type ATPase, flippase [Allomyces macrogynus ATCC 38327]